MRLKIVTSTSITVIDHISRAHFTRNLAKRALVVLTFDNGQPGETERLYYDGIAHLVDNDNHCILIFDGLSPPDAATYTADETDKDVTIKRTVGPAKHLTPDMWRDGVNAAIRIVESASSRGGTEQIINRLRGLLDRGPIDTGDIPEAGEEFFRRATLSIPNNVFWHGQIIGKCSRPERCVCYAKLLDDVLLCSHFTSDKVGLEAAQAQELKR